MTPDKQKALAEYAHLKRRIYELGQYCQALVNQIHEETEMFLSDRDFTAMDFKKIEDNSKELQQKQKEFKKLSDRFEKIKSDYDITE